MKIFFSGALGGEWRSSWQRCECLKSLGHSVVPFEEEAYVNRAVSLKRIFRSGDQYYEQNVLDEFNRDILSALTEAQPDVAWFEWPMLLRRETLELAARRLPGCLRVSFQDDNPFGTRPGELRRWQHFIEALPAYDLHFVKRPSDVDEYRKRGAQRTELFRHGFYEPLFRPLWEEEVPAYLHQEVSFIGTPLDNRANVISELVFRHRVPLRVYGNRWQRTRVYFLKRSCFRPPVLGQEYVQAICGSKICLGFVSSSNHDEYTMRTFEIPACRGFLLAERTPAHQELFIEGQEAEFFSSTEECAEKIRFYLVHESLRKHIAGRGHQRCLSWDYSLERSMARALEQIELHLAER